MKSSYMYKCVYKLDGTRAEVMGETPFEFQGGFWLDEDYKPSSWLSGTYWVPAHQIIYIRKYQIEREDSA